MNGEQQTLYLDQLSPVYMLICFHFLLRPLGTLRRPTTTTPAASASSSRSTTRRVAQSEGETHTHKNTHIEISAIAWYTHLQILFVGVVTFNHLQTVIWQFLTVILRNYQLIWLINSWLISYNPLTCVLTPSAIFLWIPQFTTSLRSIHLMQIVHL